MLVLCFTKRLRLNNSVFVVYRALGSGKVKDKEVFCFPFQFETVAKQMKLRERVTLLRYLLSDESLQHREELQQRVEVKLLLDNQIRVSS